MDLLFVVKKQFFETVRLGDHEFPAKGVMPIADVTPFHIIGGHVTFSIWVDRFEFAIDKQPARIQLVAARIGEHTVEDAAIVPFNNVLSYENRFGPSELEALTHGKFWDEKHILYQCELFTAQLDSKIVGKNPFPGGIIDDPRIDKSRGVKKPLGDYVENITHLLLYNPDPSRFTMFGSSAISMMLIIEVPSG
jgi:hypothetical protein